jgi:hypothetical protein
MKRSDSNTRGEQRSTLKSNPRKTEDTIVGHMNRIMELLNENMEVKDVRK